MTIHKFTSTRTYIPTVYMIDDRPGEEAFVSANTAEGVAAFKFVMPHLREVSRAEYRAFERKLGEGSE